MAPNAAGCLHPPPLPLAAAGGAQDASKRVFDGRSIIDSAGILLLSQLEGWHDDTEDIDKQILRDVKEEFLQQQLRVLDR